MSGQVVESLSRDVSLMTLRPYTRHRGERLAAHWVSEEGFAECGLHAEEWFVPADSQPICKLCDAA